jgi:multiple sugar transport system substrate-binding protein
MTKAKKSLAFATVASLAIGSVLMAGAVAPANANSKGTVLNFYHDKNGWDARFLEVSKGLKDGVNVTLKPTTYADTTIYQNTLNQAAKTGKGPDMMTWWSGYRMVDGAKGGLFADISDVWRDAIKAGDVSKDLQKQFMVSGKTYAIPNGVSYWPLFYNKKMFAELKLTPPKTWAEFINILDTIKREKGVAPLSSTVDGKWPSFIWFEQLLISQDPKLYLDLTSNKVKYNDPKVIAVFNIWKDMLDKGYFTAGDTSFWGDQPKKLLDQGTMIALGTWYNGSIIATGMTPGKDYDAFVIPNINPNLKTQSIIVESGAIGALAKSKNLPTAKKALREWLRFPVQAIWADQSGDGVPNPKVPVGDPVIKGLSKYVSANKVNLLQRYWESGPVPLIEGGVEILSAFVIGTKTVKQTADELTALSDKEWAAWTKKYGK